MKEKRTNLLRSTSSVSDAMPTSPSRGACRLRRPDPALPLCMCSTGWVIIPKKQATRCRRTSLLLPRYSAPLRRSVVDLDESICSFTSPRAKRISGYKKISFVTPKRLFQHYRHFCDMPTASSNIGVRAQSGKHVLMLSSSLFDRSGHCAAMEFKRKLMEVDRSARQRVWDRTTVPR